VDILSAELKMVKEELAKKTQLATRYLGRLDEVYNALLGETVESLQERVETAEYDRQLGWNRCSILQRHTDVAKKEKSELEEVLKDKERALWVLNNELSDTKIRLGCVRQQLSRSGRGAICHEEGRVLIKCELCAEVRRCSIIINYHWLTVAQAAEDPIAHVAAWHTAKRKNERRVEACPLGCGCVLFPLPHQPKVPDAEMQEHQQSERCRVRLELLNRVRAECAQYIVERVGNP
jgi:hypothetical protein